MISWTVTESFFLSPIMSCKWFQPKQFKNILQMFILYNYIFLPFWNKDMKDCFTPFGFSKGIRESPISGSSWPWFKSCWFSRFKWRRLKLIFCNRLAFESSTSGSQYQLWVDLSKIPNYRTFTEFNKYAKTTSIPSSWRIGKRFWASN